MLKVYSSPLLFPDMADMMRLQSALSTTGVRREISLCDYEPMMRLFMEVLSMPRHWIVFFPRSLNLDPFLKNSTPGTQSLKTCEIISVVKIWCVCFRASFQFARSASVRSSHVAFSFRMPCRFGVTQRFWTNMFVSFWLIYPMFFVGVILSSIIPIMISI